MVRPQQRWADTSNVDNFESHRDAAMMLLRTVPSQDTPDTGPYLGLGVKSTCLIQQLPTA